jgi:hypothetical protein
LEGVRTGLGTRDQVLAIAVGRHHDEVRVVRETVRRAHTPAQLAAVHSRHAPVAENDIGAPHSVDLRRVDSVAREPHGVA